MLRCMPDDAELLEAWRNGDRRAGTELFERYFEALRRFFVNKVDDAVEDLVQQTFLACVDRRDAIRPGTFRGYLYAVARSKLYDHLRARASAEQSLDPGSSSVVDMGQSPSAVLRAREEQRLMLQALRHLPLDLQIAVELYYLDQVKGRDLEIALGIPAGTVRSRLRRGLEQLRGWIEQLAASPQARQESSATLDAWASGLVDDAEPA
jgi:RNA polymerase sigma factor (sigma-70 family)